MTRGEDGVVIQSLGGGASAVEGLGTSPDGSTLHVTDCWDRTWNWDLAAHGVPETIGAGVRSPLRVPSPDGRTVLVRGDSPTFVRRSAADDTVVQSYVGHRGWIRAVIFIDETLIASASGDGTVRLWDVGSGETLAILISNPGERWAVLAPDGRYDVGGGGLIDSVSWLAGEVTWPVADLDPSKHVPGLLPRILAEHRSAMDRR